MRANRFGVKPELLDDHGAVLDGAPAEGNLCFAAPWPSMARSIYGDHARYEKTYFEMFPGKWSSCVLRAFLIRCIAASLHRCLSASLPRCLAPTSFKHQLPHARTVCDARSDARGKNNNVKPHTGKYFTGDRARRDEDGYLWITGRTDDVINVSGHRLGTAEVEAAIMHFPGVAKAAVVGFPHDIKGACN